MVALSLLLNYNAVIDIFGDGAELIAVLFIALAYVIGYLSGIFDKSERVVLGFAASQRNFAAAIVVATQAFGDEPSVLVMAVVISIVAMVLIPFSTFLGRRKARVEGEHARPYPTR